MIVYIIPYWRFDPCWPICGPICWEPWPASICIGANYLWRLLLYIGLIKWNPVVPWLKKDAARILHVMPSLSSRPNVKHIKLNVPANLTQLFVCCSDVSAHVCVYVHVWWPQMAFVCGCMFSCLGTLKHAGVYMWGSDWGGKREFCHFSGGFMWHELPRPATHCRGKRKLAFK